MTVILRKLSQKRHWDSVSWLEEGEVQADAAQCLATRENKLSVFVLDQCDEQVERVVAALVATQNHLTRMDFAIVPGNILQQCGIRSNHVKGETPDLKVNEWHQDLIELTIKKITLLAAAIKHQGKIKRYQERKVETAIKKSLDSELISTERIKEQLVNSLKRRGII